MGAGVCMCAKQCVSGGGGGGGARKGMRERA